MRTVGVRLTAEISDYQRKLRQAGKETKDFSGELDKAAKAGRLDAVADQAGVMGIAIGAGVGLAVKSFMDFDKQMSSVKAAVHANAEQMDQLRQAAIDAGADTQYSATEAAKGITELGKAGVSASDILGGGLKGALNLAAAGQMDVGEAAETAASALTQFKLKGQDVPHVADLLAAAAGNAQGEVSDMGAALNQVGLIAAGTGLSIEDTTGTLAAFASAGLTGSDAGTSFKTMLQAIQAPSGKTKDLMDDLGVSAYDTAGQFIGITKFAQNLKDKLSVLTPELRANALAQIFGSDATRAASILYEQGAAGVQSWIDKTNDAGYAAETAAIKTDNLAGDLERLKGSLDTLLIQSGSGTNGGLRAIAQGAEAMVDQFAKLPSGVTTTAVAMGGLTAAVLLGGAAWVKARASIAATVAELNAVGPAGARAATGLQAATKAAGRAAVAFVALEVAGAAFDAMGNASVNVDKLTASLQEYVSTGKMTEGLTDTFGKDLEYFGKNAKYAADATHGFTGVLADLSSFVPGLDTLSEWTFGTSFSDSTERMKALDESFTAFIGTQKDAKKAGELWNELLTKSGLDTQQLAELLPGAWKGLQDLQKAAHGGATAQGQLAGETEKSTAEIEEQRQAAEDLQKAFDSLFGRYMDADKAAIAYEKSLVDVNKELKDGAHRLDVHSDAGQKNRLAVLDHIKAIKEQRDANIADGMAVEDADKKYRSQITTLGKTMEKLNFTRGDIEKLIGKYREVPKQVGTSVETPGLPKASAGIKGYHKQLDDLARQIKTHVSVEGDAAAYKKLEKLLVAQQAAKKGISVSAAQSAFNKNAGYAAGGRTAMVGEGEPAGVVHGQEVVFSAATTRQIDRQAPGFIDEVLATGRLPGYAGGGRVLGMPFPVNASQTKIPDWSAPPSGGQTSDWIVAAARALVPGIRVLSKDRPGARTLSGNVSYHARGRAVDFEPSKELAREWNERYKAATKELISPYQQYNIHNGTRHSYTGAVWRQHNFAGGNAHDHIAMQHGGTITEPIFGVGASGTTYQFGENWQPERVTPMHGGGGGTTIHVTLQNHGVIGSRAELDNWLTAGIDRLKRRVRI